MALYTYHHDAPKVTEAARRWVQQCLVRDESVFQDGALATPAGFDALDRYFVQRPDAGEGTFYEKLKGQLAEAPPDASKLMAEVLWSLFLFPSNISQDVKRQGILQTWGWSGDELDPAHPLLDDVVLGGIGSAGMGVNTNRWRELNYIIGMAQAIKKLQPSEREAAVGDYDGFMDWIDTVPMQGNRQFRHMLRYYLFPERVERMSANTDRRRVLVGFDVAPLKATRKWSDRQLDDALLELRKKLQAEQGTEDLDFYLEPLRERWMSPNENVGNKEDEAEDEPNPAKVREESPAYTNKTPSRNLILYGPPGTGKTWRLKHMFERYTDQPADVDRPTWEQHLVAQFGWRPAIAAALADMGRPAKAGDLVLHPLIAAKILQRKRKRAIKSTLWSYMQDHSVPDSATVNVAVKRPPSIFDKNQNSEWFLVDDWREADAEAAELLDAWRNGPAGSGEAFKRYRVVTFHPSYSYEDFVIGLRPVTLSDESGGGTGFRMVDGVFKQICAEARSNPAKRYALFIDEINRANIAKVFGELITLIEPDKRASYDAAGELLGGMEVQLPGTASDGDDDDRFGVPANLDIIGTMNTADRSIALLDIALRRRFEFEEMPPDYKVVQRVVDGVDLAQLLRTINNRLEFLADRDRLIGHAYFTKVAGLDDLRRVFATQVIPLLQEYFYDDFSRVEQVLSNGKGRSAFVSREVLQAAKLFGPHLSVGADERTRYRLTPLDGWSAEAFISIYFGGEPAQAEMP
jgi:5-methylcytosine-specific restriction enzyme B